MPQKKPVDRYSILILLAGVLLALAVFAPQPAARAETLPSPLFQDPQQGQELFGKLCQSCHTIGGGKLVGPDLAGVTQRRDPAWVKSFIAAPDQMLASGDATAVQLLAENGNVPMPNLGLTAAQVDSLAAFLADPAAVGGAGAGSVLAGGSPAVGQALFSGTRPLANGGPACIACHSVEGVAALDGGTLGPDLTYVHSRLGAAGLSSALGTLPFPTMQGIFTNRPLTPEEQAAIYAYLANAGTGLPTAAAPSYGWFYAVGGVIALALFGLMYAFRPRRTPSLAQRLRG